MGYVAAAPAYDAVNRVTVPGIATVDGATANADVANADVGNAEVDNPDVDDGIVDATPVPSDDAVRVVPRTAEADNPDVVVAIGDRPADGALDRTAAAGAGIGGLLAKDAVSPPARIATDAAAGADVAVRPPLGAATADSPENDDAAADNAVTCGAGVATDGSAGAADRAVGACPACAAMPADGTTS